MKSISSLDNFHQLLRSNAEVIVKFSAKWCGPCKAIQPFFESLETKNPQIVFATCDCDLCPEISDLCSVQSLPTFIKFKRGQQTGSVIGTSKTDITNLLSM